MKIPKFISVLGKRYSLSVVPLPFDTAGECDKRRCEIRVSEFLEEEEFKKTLLHEIIHATIHRVGLDQAVNLETEEMICENISTIFFELFKFSFKK